MIYTTIDGCSTVTAIHTTLVCKVITGTLQKDNHVK